MNTDKKLVVAFAVVAVGLILYPPILQCRGLSEYHRCFPSGHDALWAVGYVSHAVYTTVDLGRLALYELAVAIAAGVTYFIRKK